MSATPKLNLNGMRVHTPEQCDDLPCCFHAPSEHQMVTWPMLVRETALVERLCAHGVGHPDPDSIAYFTRVLGKEDGDAFGVHGCDGCCVTARRHPRGVGGRQP